MSIESCVGLIYYWVFEVDLMTISLCFEILLTDYSPNSLKCVWELTKVKQLIFFQVNLILALLFVFGGSIKDEEACLCEMLILIMLLTEG